MKKLLVIIAIILSLIIFVVSGSNDYDGWKTVEIKNMGTIKVPDNWLIIEDGNYLYFVDKPLTESDYQIFLLQPRRHLNPDEAIIDDGRDVELYKTKGISSAIISNGVTYGLDEYELNGQTFRRYYLFFCESTSLTLIAWDDLVDRDTIIKIAESFSPFRPE